LDGSFFPWLQLTIKWGQITYSEKSCRKRWDY
jgi:hypothetical protein